MAKGAPFGSHHTLPPQPQKGQAYICTAEGAYISTTDKQKQTCILTNNSARQTILHLPRVQQTHGVEQPKRRRPNTECQPGEWRFAAHFLIALFFTHTDPPVISLR